MDLLQLEPLVVPCAVPGYVLEDLVREGIVGEPLSGMNEVADRWVAFETWTYRAMLDTLTLVGQTDGDSTLLLLFEGLDTVADVFVDSQLVLSARNFHRPHLVALGGESGTPVKGELRIVITSALNYSKQQADSHPYPLPSNTAPGAFPHYSFVRKPASDWGWDWGPALAPSGIHLPVKLVALRDPLLRGAMVHPEVVWDGRGHVVKAVLRIEVEIWASWLTGGSGDLSIQVQKPDDRGIVGATSRPVSFSPLPARPPSDECRDCTLESIRRFETVEMEIDPRDVDLWWPSGYGAQPLYRVLVDLCPGEGGGGRPGPCSLIERMVGFRTIDLVTDPVRGSRGEGADGETFFFRVNGIDIFAKGSNLVPLEVIHTRSTSRGLELLIDAALDQHLNMLRVWGGGRYQDDSLYSLCDRHGILIWQEVMAACIPYPNTDSSLVATELEREVRHQIRRLSSHPSIALWGGNNEVEASLDWFDETKASPRPFVASYQSLFVDRLAPLFEEMDPLQRYLDGSPSNLYYPGEGMAKRWGDPQSPNYGDVHFYDYTNDCMDVNTYPKARFISEFGFQSMPSFESLKPFAMDRDLAQGPFGDFMRSRQRHLNGDRQMMDQLKRHFDLPDSFSGVSGLKEWIYFTQVQQALCYETALSYWRRLAGGAARTGGVLYWQLNDAWPGQSWSAINYSPDGHVPRRKPLHYVVKKVFAPMALSTEVDASVLSIFISSEYAEEMHVTLHIRAIHITTSQTCLLSKAASSAGLFVDLIIPPQTSGQMAFKGHLSTIFAKDRDQGPPCSITSCYIDVGYHFEPTVLRPYDPHVDRSRALFSTSTKTEIQVWLAPFKDLELCRPEIKIDSFKRRSEDEVCFLVSTGNAAALLIVLDHSSPLEGRFDHNMFNLEPCGSKAVCFKGRSTEGPLDEELLESKLSYMAYASHMNR